MIDIHSHILAGLDDGASLIEESLDIAKAAVNEGIHIIYATPHHNQRYIYDKNLVYTKAKELNRLLQENHINLNVRVGQEVRIRMDLPELLKQNNVLTLGESQYVLIEFPSTQVPHYTKDVFFKLQLAGYQPIIAHPERNIEILHKPNILYDLIINGALSQVTAGSVAGNFGKKIQKLSFKLIEANLVHFIASDAHNISSRGFFINNALANIKQKFGQPPINYFKKNSLLLEDGKHVVSHEPHSLKNKKLLYLL
ncbi:tyrosine protein phosphatase [Filobacillus milosensis]|uniref:Tyrosine-protein phosphatase n=1 Tax=Filobacillus milosensis TaxID=94137 RepID=A0A4Y8IE40_9BACI|nr:CpsB/CapC family capsule biosynthesis tyrosine phosphatase [Filobacillus milosensis]TFB14190.1 tyrosine protein phosphatase [Filobacillus milosensis]